VVVDAEDQRARKTTLRGGWRGVLKNDLTEPTLLEISDFPTYQARPATCLTWSKVQRDRLECYPSASVLGAVCAVAYWKLGRVQQHPFCQVSSTKEYV